MGVERVMCSVRKGVRCVGCICVSGVLESEVLGVFVLPMVSSYGVLYDRGSSSIGWRVGSGKTCW